MAFTLEHLTKQQKLIFYPFLVIPMILAIITLLIMPEGKKIQPAPELIPTQSVREESTSLPQRQPISAADQRAKAKLITTFLQEGSGQVYSSVNVQIRYVSPIDSFMGEITTENILDAKTEAVNWFKEQGISQEGICNLPLHFYLNWEVRDELREISTEFNLLPPGC